MKQLKNLSKILGLLLLAFIVMPVSSCTKDDDGPDDGSGTGSGSGNSNGSVKSGITLGGETMKLPNVYWWIENGEMFIEFYSFNRTSTSFPKKISFVGIVYDVTNGQTEIEDVTLNSGSYRIYVAKDVTMSSPGWQGQTNWNDTTNSPLIVEKDGNKVSVKLNGATISDDEEDRTLTINYKGSIKYLDEQFWD